MREMAGSFLLLLCLIATPAAAQTSFQFSLPGVQAPEAHNVDGFRLALFHAKNASVGGFDLGIASFSEAERRSGFSMIWGLERVTGPSSGLASSFVNVHSGIDSSVNAAFINSIKTQESGANIGFINIVDQKSNFDLSGIGVSSESNVQVGFINITKKINGVQIGFLNVAENGFLPVFPFFNFPKDEP